jgi:hypothetical protein
VFLDTMEYQPGVNTSARLGFLVSGNFGSACFGHTLSDSVRTDSR